MRICWFGHNRLFVNQKSFLKYFLPIFGHLKTISHEKRTQFSSQIMCDRRLCVPTSGVSTQKQSLRFKFSFMSIVLFTYHVWSLESLNCLVLKMQEKDKVFSLMEEIYLFSQLIRHFFNRAHHNAFWDFLLHRGYMRHCQNKLFRKV